MARMVVPPAARLRRARTAGRWRRAVGEWNWRLAGGGGGRRRRWGLVGWWRRREEAVEDDSILLDAGRLPIPLGRCRFGSGLHTPLRGEFKRACDARRGAARTCGF